MPVRVGLWAIVSSSLLAACENRKAASNHPVSVGYARARWRLVPPDLTETVLWVSHIVIAHAGSNPAATILRREAWAPDPPPPKRTEREALTRALELAESLRRDPDRFEALARENSDDVVTRAEGGSLGGVRASELPPEFLDALAVLKPGEVSRVIRTAFGYHVIKRRPVPGAERVSGRRIAIRYTGTIGGKAEITRTREDAKRLAQEVARRAAADPGSFDGQVTQYSDNDDKVQGGDIGVWSLRDPRLLPREIERLGQLRIGEASQPVDSIYGFEILVRTNAPPRTAYAMTAIQIKFDPALKPDQPGSSKRARQRAIRLAENVAHAPEQFDRMRKEVCCESAQLWIDDRGPENLTRLLARMSIDEIAREPIESDSSYMIVKRLNPGPLPPLVEPRYELSSPKGPDFETLVKYNDGRMLAENVRLLSQDAARAISMEAAQANAFRTLFSTLAASFEDKRNDEKSRLEGWHLTLAELRKLLGTEGFAKFEGFLDDWATRRILASGP